MVVFWSQSWLCRGAPLLIICGGTPVGVGNVGESRGSREREDMESMSSLGMVLKAPLFPDRAATVFWLLLL